MEVTKTQQMTAAGLHLVGTQQLTAHSRPSSSGGHLTYGSPSL